MSISNILSLAAFVESIDSAQPKSFLESKTNGLDPSTFSKMKNFILDRYANVEARNSFMDENGSIFDCIPIEQQPSLKNSKIKLPKPPTLPLLNRKKSLKNKRPFSLPTQNISNNRLDKFGNKMMCPKGMVPLRRIDMREMLSGKVFEDFFKKSPYGSGRPPNCGKLKPLVSETHRWAHAYQYVDNIGGHSTLNLWQPEIKANQIFSLSQQWYTAGEGEALQTAEVGWQVFPQKYGGSFPVLFIYWTADNYNKTGCYNLDTNGFVQTNNYWTIGGTLTPVSIMDGQQISIEISFYLKDGCWWLYIGGNEASDAVGYYPISLYSHGPLATKASEIDFGGEVVGTTSWPPMGSGRFADDGWEKAAYQQDIYYYSTAGQAVFAKLNPSQLWPQCYKVNVPGMETESSETLYFGGPGGANC